jgi:hypothetical protein
MTSSWRMYLLMAHWTDETNHTACNRQLKQTDPVVGELPEKYKCKTCVHFIVKEGSTQQ